MDADWSVELGADDSALEFPWSAPDGSQHYVDLRHHPEALATTPEAHQNPELADFLRQVNAESSPWTTVKCDVWLDDELGEAEEIYDATHKFSCYVDVIARDPAWRFSFSDHETWITAAAKALSANGDDPVACELIVRRCWYHPDTGPDPEQMTAGFYVTIYLSGYGSDPKGARTCWVAGLRQVTSVVTASVP